MLKRVLSIILIFICIFSLCSCKQNAVEEFTTEADVEQQSGMSDFFNNTPHISISIKKEKAESVSGDMPGTLSFLYINCALDSQLLWEYKKYIKDYAPAESYKIVSQEENFFYIWIAGELLAINNSGDEVWATPCETLDAVAANSDFLYIYYNKPTQKIFVYNKENGQIMSENDITNMGALIIPIEMGFKDDKLHIKDVTDVHYLIDTSTYEASSYKPDTVLSINVDKRIKQIKSAGNNIATNILTQYEYKGYDILTVLAANRESAMTKEVFDAFRFVDTVNMFNREITRSITEYEDNGEKYKASCYEFYENDCNYLIFIRGLYTDSYDADIDEILSYITIK